MQSRNPLVAAAVFLACSIAAYGATPLDTVLAAFSANEASERNRSVLTITLDGTLDVYVIERVRPDRVRVVHNPDRADVQEAIVIGPTMYVRRPAGWSTSQIATPAAGAMPVLDALIRSGLSDLKELPAPAGAQSFSGRMKWTNGAADYDGRIEIVIDANTVAMLRAITFEGTCDAKPCRFRQTFTYETDLRIPTPE